MEVTGRKEVRTLSFVVARMQKMKADNLVGIGNHNQRKTKNHSNKDIDVERSNLNYDLVQGRTKNYKTDIETFINEEKTSTRATRKDAVLVNEWIITSDRPFFDKLDDERQRKFFEDSKDYFADKYGDDNIRYAQVHLDEKTPHMHLGIVPFDKDNKLSAKRVFDRKALQNIQDDFPVFLQKQGFNIERGKKNSKQKHLSVPEYKKMADEKEIIRQEVKTLKEDKKGLETKIEPLKQELSSKKNEIAHLTKETPINFSNKELNARYQTKKVEVETGEKGLFGKPVVTTKKERTGNIILPEENFEKLLNQAKKNQKIEKNVKNYMQTDLVKFAEKVVEDSTELKAEKQELVKDYNGLAGEYNELIEENTGLKQQVKSLKQEIGNIFEHVKSLFKAHTSDLKQFKSSFKSFTRGLGERTPEGEFERLHEKENKPKRTKGMSR